MNKYFAICASLVCVTLLLFVMSGTVFSAYRIAPDYKRVAIVERIQEDNGSERLTVRLSPGVEVPLKLSADDALHAEAQYVCAGIYGDPKSANAKARYAELSDCPLPISRALPQSGIVRQQTDSTTKTYRTPSISGTSGTPAGQFPKSNMGFGGSN